MKTTDLCDEYGGQVQVAEAIGFRHFGGRKTFWGQIVTVKCYEDNSLVRVAVSQNGRGQVLVVDGGGSLHCALVGDIIAGLAQQNEWAGLLIYGAIRDSEDVAAIDIGVAALGTNPRKSGKKNEGTANIPLYFAGISFVPGHSIYVDADGIVTSAAALL